MSANTNNSTSATTTTDTSAMDRDKKIIDLSDAELTALGFIGPDVPGQVQEVIDAVRASPDNMGFITCFMLDCVRWHYTIRVPANTLNAVKTSNVDSTPKVKPKSTQQQ